MRFNRKLQARLRRYHAGQSVHDLLLRYANVIKRPRSIVQVLDAALRRRQRVVAVRPFVLYCAVPAGMGGALPWLAGTLKMGDAFACRALGAPGAERTLAVVTVLEGSALWHLPATGIWLLAPASRITGLARPEGHADEGHALVSCVFAS